MYIESRAPKSLALWAALLAGLLSSAPAHAVESDPLEAEGTGAAPVDGQDVESPFKIAPPRKEGDAFVNGENPEISIPDLQARKQDQLGFGYFLMELTDKAVAATEVKDYPRAIKLYRALAHAVPERATAFSNLCHLYRLTNQPIEAEIACRDAINRAGTVVADHTSYVELYLFNHPGDVSAKVVAELDRIIGNVAARPEAAIDAAQTACLLATRLNDPKRLERCGRVLNAQLPHDPQTISYSWALAVAEGDRAGAERELQRGEAAGMPVAAITTMRERGQVLLESARSARLRVWGSSALGAALAAGLATFVVRRRKTLANA